MPYKKGQSGNLAGKPKGAKNKTTRAIEEIFMALADRYTEEPVREEGRNGGTRGGGPLESKLWNDFRRIEDPKDRLSLFLKMMEFVAPKKRSVEAEVAVESVNEVAEALKREGMI